MRYENLNYQNYENVYSFNLNPYKTETEYIDRNCCKYRVQLFL